MDDAKNCAKALIKQNLAKCVNLITNVTSFYQWENELREETEYLLIIKTTQATYHDVEMFLKTHHSYDVPEIIALPIVEGSNDYLNWLRNCYV